MSSKTIWLNPPLERLADECGRGNTGRAGRFSARLGDIVERYTALMAVATMPVLTHEELMILSATVAGSVVTPTMIRCLSDMVGDTGLAGAKVLCAKIDTWDTLTKMAAIEEAYPR